MKIRKFSYGLAAGLLALVTGLLLAAAPASATLERIGGWDGGGTIRPFSPVAVTIGSQGNAYVADYGLSRIVRIGTDDVADLDWGTGEPGASWPPNPVDLAVDGEDNVYALDMDQKEVRKFSSSGEPLGSWPVDSPYYGGRWSITFEAGSVWVLADTEVFRFDSDGDPLSLDDGAFAFESIPAFVSPIIRGDGEGHLVISSAAMTPGPESTATKSIYRFDLDGSQISRWDQPATVTRTDLPKSSLTSVSGYDTLAVDGAGDIWVSTAGADHAFKRVDANGLLPGGVGTGSGRLTLAIDAENRFWTIGSDPEDRADDQVQRIEDDGSTVAAWGADDFPDYADEVWPGSFELVSDFAVNATGQVAILDNGFRRIKVFTADGEFVRMIKFPSGVDRSVLLSDLNLADDGSIEFFDPEAGKLYRFDGSGDPAGDFQLAGSYAVRAIERTSDGGHLVVTAPDSKVTRFDAAWHQTASWELVRTLSEAWAPVDIAQGPDGEIYVSTPDYLYRYSSSGEQVGSWSLRDEECAIGGDGIHSLAIDGTGRVYAVASLSFAGAWSKIYTFDSSLDLLWSENLDGTSKGIVRSAPDGSILLSGGGIDRFVHTGTEEPGLVTSCRERADKRPDKFKLLRISYGPSRSFARIRVHAPGAGRIVIKGPKLVRKSRAVKAKGDYTLTVKAKPRFREARPHHRKLNLKVRITFRGKRATTTRNFRIHLKSKLRNRHHTRKIGGSSHG